MVYSSDVHLLVVLSGIILIQLDYGGLEMCFLCSGTLYHYLSSSIHQPFWVGEEESEKARGKKNKLPIRSSFAFGYFPPVEINRLPWQPHAFLTWSKSVSLIGSLIKF